MSRRRRAEKREINPDAKFGDLVLAKFMNSLMYAGKKSAAEGIIYGAFDVIQDKTKQDPLQVFHEALRNVAPALEVRSRRVGGATYQVPVEVRTDRSRALAIRWLINAARSAQRADHDRAAFGGASRRREQSRKRRQEARRHAQDGGGEPRLLPLPLVTRTKDPEDAATDPARTLPQHRHCRAYRCRQDDDDRAHPLLHRPQP